MKPNLSDYSHIVWDFNGTILDDVLTGITSVNTMLSARGLKTISDIGEYHRLFGFPIQDYYARLGFDFDKESYASLAIEWVDLYNANSDLSHIRPGVIECAGYFAEKGIRQVVISASEQNMLRRQLGELGVIQCFDEVFGLDNIHAESKTALAERWFENEKPHSVLFIGDTSHDFDTACAVGADCVLICGGHQSRGSLLECGCTVYDDFFSLLEELRKNGND